MKVRTRIHNNEFCRTYHCNQELIERRQHYSNGSIGADPEEDFQKLSDKSKQLATDILKINGVKALFIHEQYELQVVIGEAFDWNEIEPEIKSAIEKFAGDEAVEYLDTKVDQNHSYLDY